MAMKNNGLVSIITPCYNGADYIYRLFDSILAQTYNNIEFIFVNDGSTDETEKVALSYKEKFEEKGIKYIYISKNNGGVASAINEGLKVFSGEYLTWPDADDWMTPDCIEKKVRYLEDNLDCGMVITQLETRLEETPNACHGVLKFKNTEKRNIFEDLLLENYVYVAPIGYMARSSMLLEVCPTRNINDTNRMGQNWQMMLPICYRHPCGFIDEKLGYYLIRANSLSHSGHDLEARYKKIQAFFELKKNALSTIHMTDSDRKKYDALVVKRYYKNKLVLAAKLHNKEYLKETYAVLQQTGQVGAGDKIWYLRGRSKAFNVFFGIIVFPIRAWKSLVRRIKKG